MYDKIKVLLNHPTYRYIIVCGIGVLICLCIGYIFYQPSGTNYQRTLNAVERIEKQQRESIKLNRDIQSSIDRSTELSHEAKGRIERSTQYNQQIGERINASQTSINEARNCLVRNAELFDRVKGQIDNDKRTIKRLRMQRNLSQILGAGATIGVVIHR